jgi:hypothetical protein
LVGGVAEELGPGAGVEFGGRLLVGKGGTRLANERRAHTERLAQAPVAVGAHGALAEEDRRLAVGLGAEGEQEEGERTVGCLLLVFADDEDGQAPARVPERVLGGDGVGDPGIGLLQPDADQVLGEQTPLVGGRREGPVVGRDVVILGFAVQRRYLRCGDRGSRRSLRRPYAARRMLTERYGRIEEVTPRADLISKTYLTHHYLLR